MSQRKKENVREAILEAAFRLFSERGYANTSMPAIAKEAGISSANAKIPSATTSMRGELAGVLIEPDTSTTTRIELCRSASYKVANT